MTLPDSVLRRVIDALAVLYAPGTSDQFPARVIAVTAGLIDAESCSYNEFGPSGQVAYGIEPIGVGKFPDSDRIFQRHLPEHPVLAHVRSTGDGTARRISDFLSDRQFRALGLYRDFYRPAGVAYQAAMTVPAPDDGLIGVAVNRTGRDFTDDERATFDLLRPHIARAAMTVTLLSQAIPQTPRTASGAPLLTPRQTRVLQLVAAGHTDRLIARALGISTRTVHTHLQHTYRTLGVTSRVEALAQLRRTTLIRSNWQR